MPKGVEHFGVRAWVNFNGSVESLMPKGVEHGSPLSSGISFSASVESLMPKGVEHNKTFVFSEY